MARAGRVMRQLKGRDHGRHLTVVWMMPFNDRWPRSSCSRSDTINYLVTVYNDLFFDDAASGTVARYNMLFKCPLYAAMPQLFSNGARLRCLDASAIFRECLDRMLNTQLVRLNHRSFPGKEGLLMRSFNKHYREAYLMRAFHSREKGSHKPNVGLNL